MKAWFEACASLLLFLASAAHAEDWEYQTRCKAYAVVPIPAADSGHAADKCDARVLYYGEDGSAKEANFAAARACAYRQRANKVDDNFGGPAILMMLYANGLGVQRNIPLAKRFACEIDGAPAEMDIRLDHLDKMAKHGPGKDRFDVCDDLTSGYLAGFCAGRDFKFDQVKRKRRIEDLATSWTRAQKDAYSRLRQSADAYFHASAEKEVDSFGPWSASREFEALDSLEDGFMKSIEHFERDERPEAAAGALRAEDAELNSTFQELMRNMAEMEAKQPPDTDTIKTAGVRDTQRKWLGYRDSWVAFAALRYPRTPADAWRAWLTHERTKMLKQLSNPEDSDVSN